MGKQLPVTFIDHFLSCENLNQRHDQEQHDVAKKSYTLDKLSAYFC